MISGNDAGLTPLAPVFLVDRFPSLHAEDGAAPRIASERLEPAHCLYALVSEGHRRTPAHGGIRRLSFGRDGLDAAPDVPVTSHSDLVTYLNRLNADWTAAARRLSPRVLIDLLDFTARQVHAFFQTLDPHSPALFPVAWAGQDVSPNWFDIGREYTERWLHQQQIREAVGAPGLTGREWLHPTLDIFVRALPFTYRNVGAPPGRSIRFEVRGESGGAWTLVRAASGWELFLGSNAAAAAIVNLDQETAWKLFSKGLDHDSARRRIRIEGDTALGEPVLGSLAVMA